MYMSVINKAVTIEAHFRLRCARCGRCTGRWDLGVGRPKSALLGNSKVDRVRRKPKCKGATHLLPHSIKHTPNTQSNVLIFLSCVRSHLCDCPGPTSHLTLRPICAALWCERARERRLRAQLYSASVHVKVVSGVVPDLAELGQPHAQVAREPLHQDLARVRVRARATVTAAQAPPWAHVRMTGLLHLAPLAVGPLELHDERGVG